MSPHKNALKLLFPLELQGAFDDFITVVGGVLDELNESAARLRGEMFPDSADKTIDDYERVCALTPGESDTLQARRDRVVAKFRERGSLKLSYYEGLAAMLGYDVDIEQLPPNAAGYEGYGAASIFIWRITVNDAPVYYFRTGESECGERLLDWSNDNALEEMFEDLKPAHTMLIWAYT